jgi:hypothetical protein
MAVHHPADQKVAELLDLEPEIWACLLLLKDGVLRQWLVVGEADSMDVSKVPFDGVCAGVIEQFHFVALDAKVAAVLTTFSVLLLDDNFTICPYSRALASAILLRRRLVNTTPPAVVVKEPFRRTLQPARWYRNPTLRRLKYLLALRVQDDDVRIDILAV